MRAICMVNSYFFMILPCSNNSFFLRALKLVINDLLLGEMGEYCFLRAS